MTLLIERSISENMVKTLHYRQLFCRSDIKNVEMEEGDYARISPIYTYLSLPLSYPITLCLFTSFYSVSLPPLSLSFTSSSSAKAVISA